MSKLEDGETVLTHEFISLVEFTQDIVTIVIGRAVDAGIVWDYEKGKAVIPYPYIYGSPLHLRQIFLNIYGNCIKYTRPGGKSPPSWRLSRWRRAAAPIAGPSPTPAWA